jgi:hypothetical protein
MRLHGGVDASLELRGRFGLLLRDGRRGQEANQRADQRLKCIPELRAGRPG